MSMICPKCKKDDSIQKVSVIVASGRSSGTYSGPSGGIVHVDGKWGSVGGYTTLTGSAISDLARLLAAPLPPHKPTGYGNWWFVLWYPAMIFWSLFIGLCSLPAFTIALWRNANSAPIDASYGMYQIVILLFLIPGIIVGSILSIRIICWFERNKRKNNEEKYRPEKALWDQVMVKWNRLFFCHRDGIVFDPKTRVMREANDMNQLLQ